MQETRRFAGGEGGMRSGAGVLGCWGANANAKITVTGAAADQTTFATLLSTCTNGTVTIAADGTMSIAGAAIKGCGTIVQDIINDNVAANTVTVDVVNKSTMYS